MYCILDFISCRQICDWSHKVVKMKVAVTAATSRTGQFLFTQALEAGHHVVALVRSPDKVTTKHDNLQVNITFDI